MARSSAVANISWICVVLWVLTRSCAGLDISVPRFELLHDLKERVDLHQSANYLLMPHIYRAFIRAGAHRNFTENHQISETCQGSLEQYYKALTDKRAWAWKMYDATGKQAAGVFIGATTWTGNYDECLNFVGEHCTTPGQSNCIKRNQPEPQYCSVYMTHAPWLPELISSIKLPFPVPYSPFIVDVCVPNNCSSGDIRNVVEAFLEVDNNGDNITVSYVYCHKKTSITDDIPALVSVLVLLADLLLVALGTAYDIYRRRKKVRVKQGPEITIGYDDDSDHYGILKILVPPRKHRRRRATLSSSEPVDLHQVKETVNGTRDIHHGTGDFPHGTSDYPARLRSVSESAADDGTKPLFDRLNSTTSAHELQDIPEANEMAEMGNSTQVTNPASPDSPTGKHRGFASDSEANDVTSYDGTSLVSDTADGHGDVYDKHSIHLAPRISRQASIIEVRPSHRNKKLAPTDNLLTDLLLSFSFRKNTRHILADGSPDTLFCLNGVRVLSIGWIVLGNVYGIIYQNPEIVDNDVSSVKMTQSWWMQMVINTTLAADSFFVLSGTLGAYNFLKVKTRAGRNKETSWRKVMSLREYGFMIVHRWFRIFPCYAVLLLLGTNIMPYLGRGPRWSYEIELVKQCKKNWWTNALFLNNFIDADHMCQPHTYYLACDFQFFLVSPLVLIPLLITPKVGFGIISFFVIGQVVVVSVLNQGINGNVLRMKVNDYWNMIYVKPYSRIGVYCIGLALGYFLFHCDRQMKFRKIPLYLGWIVTCIIIFLLTYITYIENREGGRQWTGVETALYEAFSRPLWAIALSWVIFACTTGQGAFVGKFLSWNLFLPLCRITYGVFLLHPVLIGVVIESSYHNLYLNFGSLVYMYIALFVCSYGLAFLLISCVEAPITAFESHVRLRFKAWNKERKLKKLTRSA